MHLSPVPLSESLGYSRTEDNMAWERSAIVSIELMNRKQCPLFGDPFWVIVRLGLNAETSNEDPRNHAFLISILSTTASI
jgi:hypothetical protein